MFVGTNVGYFIIKPGLHDAHLMREAMWIRVSWPQIMWGKFGNRVHDVHEARNSSHDAKRMDESSLTRVQIPTELPFATRHPRTNSSITQDKFTLIETCRILPCASDSRRVSPALDYILLPLPLLEYCAFLKTIVNCFTYW